MGDVAMTYGSARPDFVVGTAVQSEDSPLHMLVQLGTDDVDCETYLDRLFSFDNPEGYFAYFTVLKEPGAYVDTTVAAMRDTGSDTHINLADGSVVIDAVDARVVGSLVFSTRDDEVGEIAVSGGFDVKRCF